MDIKQELEQIEQELSKLHDRKFQLENLLEEQRNDELLTSNIFAGTKWQLWKTPDKISKTVRLELMSRNVFEKYMDDYHFSFELLPDLTFGCADNDVYLYGSWEVVYDFIVAQKLIVDMSHVNNTLKVLYEQTAYMELLKDKFNGDK